MKQLTTYNRVAGYLNKIFDLLNIEYLPVRKNTEYILVSLLYIS